MQAKKFAEFFGEELGEVAQARRVRREYSPDADEAEPEPRKRARAMQLVGLAFSGGGIRSATFNLGVLQGLAKVKQLNRFDYISTRISDFKPGYADQYTQ